MLLPANLARMMMPVGIALFAISRIPVVFRRFRAKEVLLILVLSKPIISSDLDLGAYLAFSRPIITVASGEMFPELDLSTNNGPGYGLMAEYGDFSIEITPALFGEAKHRSGHGPTFFFDLKLSHYERAWGADLYYQYFRGFFSDSTDFRGEIEREGLNSSAFILNAYFPVLKGSSVERMDDGIDGNGIKFNLLYLLGASNKRLATDSSLVIPTSLPTDSRIYGLRKLNISDAFAGLGGGVHAFFHGLLFDYTLFLGAGPQYRTADIPVDAFKPSLKIHMQAKMGYAWKKASLGMIQKFDMNGFSQTSENIVFTTLQSKVYASVRF